MVMNRLLEFKSIVKNYITTLDLIKKTLQDGGALKSVEIVDELKTSIHSEIEEMELKLETDYKSGAKRKCDDCDGRGFYIKKETRPKKDYPPNLPDSGWVTEEVDVEHKCLTCNGKGYLELKWV